MAILLSTCVLFLLLSWMLILYIRRINYFRKYILPKQVVVVNRLLHDISTSKIELSVCAGSDQEKPQVFTLFEIGAFIDENYRFSNEVYDEYALFFTGNDRQILNFERYISDPMLPNDIRDELNTFYNKEFKRPSKLLPPFFKISLGGENYPGHGLFTGTGEAFENWLTFKESADNLRFMIQQWLRKSEESQV